MITTGFVAVGPDGTYYARSERSTHTGHHITWAPVAIIEHATVFPGPHLGMARSVERRPANLTMVPVQVERIVTLLGYGVAGY